MLIRYAGSERRSGDVAPEPARRSGNYRGRKPGSTRPVFTAEDDAEIIRLYNEGAPYDFIAEEIGQPRSNIFKRCRLLELPLRVGRWRKLHCMTECVRGAARPDARNAEPKSETI